MGKRLFALSLSMNGINPLFRARLSDQTRFFIGLHLDLNAAILAIYE